jgi:hypothetical protein
MHIGWAHERMAKPNLAWAQAHLIRFLSLIIKSAKQPAKTQCEVVMSACLFVVSMQYDLLRLSSAYK